MTEFEGQGYGRGMGRNHDMVIWNADVFVGIEGKADEPFGDKTIGDELKKASDTEAPGGWPRGCQHRKVPGYAVPDISES